MDWWQSTKEWLGISKNLPKAEGNRSQYSLVSCGELTEDTLQLWLGLPDEVKNDPALAPFRKLYEKEHGKIPEISKSPESHKRLANVQSAPMLPVHSDDIYDIISAERRPLLHATTALPTAILRAVIRYALMRLTPPVTRYETRPLLTLSYYASLCQGIFVGER